MTIEKKSSQAAYKKYAKPRKSLSARITEKVPNWLALNVMFNASLFLWGSLIWLYGSNTRQFDPEYDTPGGPATGPYLELRTYTQALKDAYWPMENGEFSPDFSWKLNAGMALVFALLSMGQGVAAIGLRRHADLKRARAQMDIKLNLEKLAREHNLDATAAKKMLAVAPEIVKNMSADSRVYFDMIMDGRVSVDNKDFLNMAAAVMAGHLQSHPEDMARVIALFDEKQIPHEILKQHMQNKKQK